MRKWSAKLEKKVFSLQCLLHTYLRIVHTELKVAKQKMKDENSRRKKDEAISALLHRWSDDILPNWEAM